MATILFYILPQHGHHNASYFIGNLLQKRGHSIVYASINSMRATILANGFQFYKIPEDNMLMADPVPYKRKKTLLSPIKSRVNQYKIVRKIKRDVVEKDFFSGLINDTRPDLILIDGTFKIFSLQLKSYDIPYMFVETTVSTKKYKNIPPLNSSYVPSNTAFSKWWTSLQWHWLKFNFLRPSIRKFYKYYCRKINYPYEDIDFNRYFFPGCKSVPEVNTSILQFDYPHKLPKNHIHIYPTKIKNRNEVACDWIYTQSIQSIVEDDKKVVYCSLGTLAWRYLYYDNFIKNLVKAFKAANNINLIVCVVDDNLRRALHRIKTDNIFLFRRVPQIEILSSIANIMINHGGLNSITECILTGIPMLVCPGERRLDQYGNAGRVKYHRIGLQGSFMDSPHQIMKKINILLNQPEYKQNILALRNKIQQEDDTSETGIEFIESMIRKVQYDVNHQRKQPVYSE